MKKKRRKSWHVAVEAQEVKKEITIKIPIHVRPGVYQSTRVDTKLHDAKQRMAFRALFDAISHRRHLADGHLVNSQTDAIRWLLEQIADQIGAKLSDQSDKKVF